MRRTSLLAALTLAIPTALMASPAYARDTSITSFDGTKIGVHFFPADNLPRGERAPVVLLAHGYGESAPTSRTARLLGAASVPKLLARGYNVLTWNARGHGSSGGIAKLNSPDYEVRDTKAIIDWAAQQPEVQLDAPGDPRVGMTGSSYGGIIQYLTAAFDSRVDVITPGYTAYSLSTTMITTNGKFKEGWGAVLAGMGLQTVPPGLISPFGPSLHTPDPELARHILTGVATGVLSEAGKAYLDYRSPSTYLDRVRIPTLVIGGTSDTLFPLTNAIKDFTHLKQRGVPVQMQWNCEGHSLCPGKAGPIVEHFDDGVIGWFDRWLKRNPDHDTGPQFSWIADNESDYRSANTFPPRASGQLLGSASGSLLVAPVAPPAPGAPLLGALPAIYAVNVPISAPSGDSDVVGYPRLTLTYSGRAIPMKTWIYGQVLDTVTGRVVGAQITPVPVVLDGAPHTVSIDLNAIATRASSGSKYRLQLMPSSPIFGLQRSTGTVRLSKIGISLPVIDATAR